VNARGAFEIGHHQKRNTSKKHRGRFRGDETFTGPEAGLAARKARASCPPFLGACRHEAKVRVRMLALIGGVLPPGDAT